MNPLAKHRTIITILVFLLIVAAATVSIFYTRGFKPNLKTAKIDRTGLIVANSIPTGAQVYLDDRLTSATNTSIAFLEPKTYKVRIEKEGYTNWEKDITIVADLATEIHALLFPQAPEIKPLTITGATNPTLSPDSSKIVYAISTARGGLYLLPMVDTPFSFRQNTRLLAKNTPNFDYSKATFTWDPDSKQVLARFADENGKVLANLLVDTEKTDQQPNDITGSLAAALANWQSQIDIRAASLTLLAPDEVKAATATANIDNSQSLIVNRQKNQPSPSSKSKTINDKQSTIVELNYHPNGLVFSPNEDKILYKNKDNKYHAYDLKQKKDYTMPDFSDFINISWYPDSDHLVVAQKDLISIIEADGSNKVTVYSGKFEDGFVFAHPSGTKLVILTTLTQQQDTPANLYAINLR